MKIQTAITGKLWVALAIYAGIDHLLCFKVVKVPLAFTFFYTRKNIADNAIYIKKKKSFYLNKNFFNNPNEVLLRSISSIFQILSGILNFLTNLRL